MDQKKTIRPFSMKDKIGYTLGDLGCCFTEQYRAMYLSIFYTLILQVNPFHVGILLLITKIWDAVNDPIIGAMVDSRKATKGGKFIPWIRAFSFPMAVLCILGFVNVGNINYGLRLAYMFVTYVLYEALYTCVNVPFGTLSSVMTDDVSQRTALSRYRSLGGTIFMTVMVMIGPLFLYVDNQPVAGRFLMLACICAMLGLLCLQITCVWCKERVEVPERPQGEKLNYLHVLKEISHNKALLGVMFFSLTGMIGASVVNGLNTYLYKDFFGNVKIQAVSGMLSVLYAVLSFAITQPLANKFGKKEWCCMGAGFAAIVFGILFLFPVHNPVTFIVINGICYLGASGMQVLIWAMVNDAIDYHELHARLAEISDAACRELDGGAVEGVRSHSVVCRGYERLVVRDAQHMRDIRLGNGSAIVKVQQVVGIRYVESIGGIRSVKFEHPLLFVVDYRHFITSLVWIFRFRIAIV